MPEADWNGKTGTACLGDWAARYLDHAQAHHVEKTYKEKKAVFRTFFKEVDPTLSVGELTRSMVQTYIDNQKKARTGNAANKDRKNLAAAWEWGMESFDTLLPAPNPCRVKKAAADKSPRYVPPEQDYLQAYNTAEEQDKVMLLFAFALAARRGEIFRTRITDLDFQSGRIRLWTRKRADGSWEYDWLPLPPELRKAIDWWLANRPIKEHTHLFYCLEDKPHVGIQYGQPFVERKNFMNRLCDKAGVKPFGFHGIRHLRATILYHQGKTIAAIQRLLRHKNPNTTVKYLRALGLDMMSEELKDLTFQNGENLVFESESKVKCEEHKNKKPSGEPSTRPAAYCLTDYKVSPHCNH
jgi:integrase